MKVGLPSFFFPEKYDFERVFSAVSQMDNVKSCLITVFMLSQPLRRVFEEGKNQIFEAGWAAIFTNKKMFKRGVSLRQITSQKKNENMQAKGGSARQHTS